MSLNLKDLAYEKRVEKGLADDFMRQAVSSAQERLKKGRLSEAEIIGNWEEWRSLGAQIRNHTLNHLDYYLTQLSDNVQKRGGKVFFAETKEEANAYILKVIKERNGQKIAKSKSMMTEELGLNRVLEKESLEVVETDLGEWILQLDEDPPSHLVAPALHKNKTQIKDTFDLKRDYTGSDSPAELTAFAREQLRKEFLSADIGITGCNFAVAESGSTTLVTNEGNARLVSSLPDTQITVMGMERIVPTWEELDVLVTLLTRSAVGQKISTYLTANTGVRLEDEVDGPEEFHLVIVDNGRSKILGTEFQEALNCIRCGACSNVCPVYRHIGGHAYNSVYSGPIGAVLSPLLDGYENHQELPHASTLCGACTEACPVKIPLHEQLVMHRQKMVELGINPKSEKVAMQGFAKWASTPSAYKLSAHFARTAMTPWIKDEQISHGPGPLKAWTDSRDFKAPSKQTFRSWYKKRAKEGVSK